MIYGTYNKHYHAKIITPKLLQIHKQTIVYGNELGSRVKSNNLL